MKLAMSNIGWHRHDDPSVFVALRASGVCGIEVAPTKVWPDWVRANEREARAYRRFLEGESFVVPALQAILFGKPELHLFAGDRSRQDALIEHMRRVADIAAALGARALVFGAPKARLRGELAMPDAVARAVEVFRVLAQECAARETCLCIEPNPVEYGCDFVTDASSALELVRQVGHEGFGLHLDAAALHLAGEALEPLLPRALPFLRHYHISEPFLVGFDAPRAPHAAWLRTLLSSDYEQWVSVEVDAQKHELARTLDFLSRTRAELARAA